MASRLLIIIALLTLCMAQLSFGATVPLPPRQTTKKTSSPPAGEVTAPPVTILSIIPAQGEPGMSVTLYGTGFSEKTTVFLAHMELPARVAGSQQLSFDILKLDPGLYALFLKREDGTTSRPYNFTITPLKPVATSLSPDTVYSCSTGRDREVTVAGHNFREGSQVMFDGAAVRSRFSSSESLSFSVPHVAGGLHQVQVRNPEDTLSGVLGLVIDARPEITGVSQGEQRDVNVTYYNMIIDGRNFQQNSTLVVMEEQSLEENPSPLAVDIKRITSGSGTTTEREQLLFINCNRIIYQRHPYSTVPKNFSVQVVSPGSEGESSVVSVRAP